LEQVISITSGIIGLIRTGNPVFGERRTGDRRRSAREAAMYTAAAAVAPALLWLGFISSHTNGSLAAVCLLTQRGPPHPTLPAAARAATPLVCGAIFLAIAVRSLKRFFRGMLSPDGVVVSLGALGGGVGGAARAPPVRASR
jgi:hypothetical protein